jgi:adenylate cyclase
MAALRVKTGPNKGNLFDLMDSPLTVGREESQVIQILDQGVSRAHAEIFHLGEACFVRDLNSTNGTWVNNVRITEESLRTGDEILIGATVLVFEDPDATVTETTGKEPQSRNLVLISRLDHILRTERDLQTAYEKAVEVITGAIGANQGYLFWIDPGDKLAPRVSVDGEDDSAGRKASRTIMNRVRKSALPLLTADAAIDERFSLSESVILKKIKSVICAPLLVGDKVGGLLYFHSAKAGHAFTTEDFDLVTAASLQIALATARPKA